MNHSRKFLVLALSVGLFNCSKHAPLTSDQKAQLKATVNSAGAGLNVAKSQKTQRSVNTNSRGFFSTLTGVQFSQLNASKTVTSNDDQYQLMADRLEQCAVNVDDGSNQARPGSSRLKKSVKMVVDGKQCPITLNSSIAIDGKENSASSSEFSIKVVADYKVIDDSFRKLNDVDGLKINFETKINGSEKSLKASMNFDGEIKSQNQGKVSIKGDGSFSGNSDKVTGDLTMEFAFKDFTAELGMKVVQKGENSEPVVQYTLNGEEMTEEQVQEFFGEAFKATEDYQGSVGGLGL